MGQNSRDALFGEEDLKLHRNGSTPHIPPTPTRFAVPLWRAVLRYWVGVVIVVAIVWNDASGHSASGFRLLLVVATVTGGAAALAIAWISKSRTSDRRLLYSAWSASAILAAFIVLLLKLGSDAQIIVVAGVMFVVFLATVARLNR